MTTLTDRTRHLDRISSALAVAKEAFLRSGDMEGDHKAIRALVNEFGISIRDLVDACTADFHDETSIPYLDGIENAINDDVDNEFCDAIDARDRAKEARRDRRLRVASRSDRLRDERRDHEAMEKVHV